MLPSVVPPGVSYLELNFQNEIKKSLGKMPYKSSLFGDNRCHTHYLLFLSCKQTDSGFKYQAGLEKFIFVYFLKAV